MAENKPRLPLRRAGKALHQVIWLSDECLRCAEDDRFAGAGEGFDETRKLGRGRSRHSQHLPYPRTGGGKDLLRARQGARARRTPAAGRARHADRRRRLRRPGRGRPRSCAARAPSISSSVRRTITACPSCLRRADAAAASSIPNSRPRTSSTISSRRSRADAPARRHRLRHGAGRLRQVLHLLRRALYARRRSLAPGRRKSSPRSRRSPQRACAKSRCSARTSTPITARAPDGRSSVAGASSARGSPRCRASRGCAIRRAIQTTWTMDLIAAHRDLPALMPYLHLPVQSGSDRDPRRDEPQARSRRLSSASSRGCARRAPISRCRRISSSAFRARARPISPRRSLSSARSASPAPFPSNIRRAPARRAPICRIRCPRRCEGRRGSPACRSCSTPSGRRSIAGLVGRTLDVLFEKEGPTSRPDRRQVTLSTSRPGRGA